MPNLFEEIKKPFVSPVPVGTVITIPPVSQVCILYESIGTDSYYFDEAYIDIVTPGGTTTIAGENTGGTLNADTPVQYAIVYRGIAVHASAGSIPIKENFRYTYYIQAVENKLPLKKWTCTEVINRLLDIAEPLRQGEKPRFRLQGVNDDGSYEAGSQAELFDTIYAPEFSMTKQTLRECLQQVGEIVHGEPRLTPRKDSTGEWYYEVTYDLFGQGEAWKHAHMPHVLKQVVQNANSYATSIDSAVENIVNVKGAVTEPYAGGGKSMRAVEEYVRVTEDNIYVFH